MSNSFRKAIKMFGMVNSDTEPQEPVLSERKLVQMIMIRALRDALTSSKASIGHTEEAAEWLLSEEYGYLTAEWWAEIADQENFLRLCRIFLTRPGLPKPFRIGG